MDNIPIESLVAQASTGDKLALEEVVRRSQDKVYRLALRMLWHPLDAEDATQEILIKVITHLSNFRGESAFDTWVYRVASNHLLTLRKMRAEQPAMSFDVFGQQLDEGLALAVGSSAPPEIDRGLLVEEAKLGCMQGMLLCLDRDHRIAYILGEIMEMSGVDAGYVLDIQSATFRKRLSRARTRLRQFMQQKCGLFNSANPCRCSRQVAPNVERERIDTKHLLFARHGPSVEEDSLIVRIKQIDELERAGALFRSHPNYAAPESFLDDLRKLIQSGQFGPVD